MLASDTWTQVLLLSPPFDSKPNRAVIIETAINVEQLVIAFETQRELL
jgi:hypothetical protein